MKNMSYILGPLGLPLRLKMADQTNQLVSAVIKSDVAAISQCLTEGAIASAPDQRECNRAWGGSALRPHGVAATRYMSLDARNYSTAREYPAALRRRLR